MIIQITTTHEALAALLTTETYYQLAPSQTHSEFALFGEELDCASVVTATHAPSSHRFLSTWGAVMLITPQVERKKIIKYSNVEKSHKSVCVSPIL